MNDILLIGLLNIVVFLMALHLGYKNGFNNGYMKGVKEEQLVMGLSIARAYKDDKEEALKRVGSAYKQLILETEQEMRDRKSNV